MTRLLSILAVAAVAVVGIVFWSSTQQQAPGVSLGSVSAQEAADIDTSAIVEMRQGNPDASVKVVEYASFTCPHCRAFHEDSYAQFKADYIDTGKIDFIYREVYFDRFGLWAAMVARCAGPERYFGVADMIYDEQREWIGDGAPATIVDNLRKIGLRAGLEQDEVNACLQDGEMAKALVAVYQQNATADGVEATPTFLVNGQKVSGNNYPEVKRLIDEALN